MYRVQNLSGVNLKRFSHYCEKRPLSWPCPSVLLSVCMSCTARLPMDGCKGNTILETSLKNWREIPNLVQNGVKISGTYTRRCMYVCMYVFLFLFFVCSITVSNTTRVGTLIVATIYLQFIYNLFTMPRSGSFILGIKWKSEGLKPL